MEFFFVFLSVSFLSLSLCLSLSISFRTTSVRLCCVFILKLDAKSKKKIFAHMSNLFTAGTIAHTHTHTYERSTQLHYAMTNIDRKKCKKKIKWKQFELNE